MRRSAPFGGQVVRLGTAAIKKRDHRRATARRVAVIVFVIVGSALGNSGFAAGPAILAQPAGTTASWSYQALTFGGPTSPVMSPQIVPIYWGKGSSNWVAGGGLVDDDPNLINNYIDHLALYMSGVDNPTGYEPVMKQYGVWGAQRYAGTYTCTGACSQNDSSTINDNTIRSKLSSLIANHSVPANTTNTLYVIFTKGFSYNFGFNACAYHWNMNSYGPIYVVIPYELAALDYDGSLTQCSFQQALSHEIFEAATDPTTFEGWQYGGGSEGGDECQPGSGAGAAGMAQFPWGYVQTFADNVTGSCSLWSWPTTSTLAASTWPQNGEFLNVFFNAPLSSGFGGDLIHAFSPDGVSWSWEVAGTAPFPVRTGAPAVVHPAANRLDVFVRAAGPPPVGCCGTNSPLYHFSNTVNGSWASNQLYDGGMAQPSAISASPNTIDIASRGWDSSVIHSYSTDNVSFSTEALPLANIVATIGPPVLGPLIPLNLYTLDLASAPVVADKVNGSWGFGVLDQVGTATPRLPVPGVVVERDQYSRLEISFINSGYSSAYEERQGYRASMTIKVNGSWLFQHYLMFDIAPFGNMTALSNGTGIDIVWQDRVSFGYMFRHYDIAAHGWGVPLGTMANWSSVINLGGQYLNPPTMTYGTDGAVYVFGVGLDDSLYVTQVAGLSSSGPSSTGITGVL